MKKNLLILLLGFFLAGSSHAQIREIPPIVEDAFARQYPQASHIDFKDQLVKVEVHFEQEGEKYLATYTNKGLWRGTEKEWAFEKLSDEVKTGFEKSRYADDEWEVRETAVLYLPGGTEQYRVLVAKNDVQKKYLFFNKEGRLLRTSITL